MASPTELSLDCKPNIESLVLKSCVEKTQKLEEFVARLEEEKLKIDAFKRELPLCMQLLTNVLEASRQELQSQRMKQLSADKANWMASATLWNHEAEGTPELGLAPPSYCKQEMEDAEVSRRENSVGHNKEKRKARRCWSPHLHRRFLNALHMLGGPQRQDTTIHNLIFWSNSVITNLSIFSAVATPKQITQLMKVEGLTSDEVKSHLQKYRLHTGIRAPSPVVVVGSIWVPPEYAAHGAAPPAAFYGATTRRVMPPP